MPLIPHLPTLRRLYCHKTYFASSISYIITHLAYERPPKAKRIRVVNSRLHVVLWVDLVLVPHSKMGHGVFLPSITSQSWAGRSFVRYARRLFDRDLSICFTVYYSETSTNGNGSPELQYYLKDMPQLVSKDRSTLWTHSLVVLQVRTCITTRSLQRPKHFTPGRFVTR